MAGEDIGKAEIEVTGDFTRFPQSVERGVKESLAGTDPEFKKAGESWGDEASKSLGTRLKSRVPQIVHDFTSEFNRQKVTEHVNVDTDYDKDNVKNTVRKIAQDIEKEVASGDLFGFFGRAITDAIGSGFNVSGKSPLIALLIPTIGAIAALIVGAIEAVNGLAAALLTIPNLIGAIAIQAGVLYLAFKSIGTELTKALAATNAKELQAALFGLNPILQNFILEVVQIRDAFRDIGKYAGLDFFRALGNTLLDVFNFNRYTLFTGILTTATFLGNWFKDIGAAFQTPEFAKFLYDLFQQIDIFLASNGPTLQKFLTQVFIFLDSLMGATGDVGKLFNDFLKTFGDWLAETAKSKDFQDWLKELPGLLTQAGRLLASLFDLILVLFSSIDKAGGQKFVDQLIFMINLLTAFFSSDLGIESLKLLLIIILVLTAAFVDLVIAIGAVLGGIQDLGNWLTDVAGPAIEDFFNRLGHAIADGLTPKPITDFLSIISNAFDWLTSKGFEWGKGLISNFIRGMLLMKPAASSATGQVVAAVSGQIPHSPAKFGPFSGSGAPEQRGEDTMADFAKGIMKGGAQVNTAINSALSNVNFGTGAVIANFYGAQPTKEQAQTLGSAVGNGIGDQLLARNARLAVRTM